MLERLKILLVCLTKGLFTSLSIRCLKAYLADHAPFAEVTVREINGYGLSNAEKDDLFTRIDGEEWDVIGVSVYSFNRRESSEFFRFLRKSPTRRVLLAGGPYFAWSNAEQAVEEVARPDFVVVGEGEEPLLAVLRAVHDQPGGEIAPTEGMRIETYRLNGAAGTTVIENTVPLDLRGLGTIYHPADDPILPGMSVVIEGSRGCRNSCAYCTWHGKRLRFHDIGKICTELKHVFAQEPRNILFTDSNLLAGTATAFPLLEFLSEHNTGNCPVELFLELGDLKDDVLRQLASLPCISVIEVGLQSSSKNTCEKIGRRFRPTEFREQFESLRDTPGRRFELVLDVILGMPFSTFEEHLQSIRDAISLKPDCIYLFLLQVLPGSAICSDPDHYGVDYDQERYYVRSTNRLDPHELHRLFALATGLSLTHNFPKTAALLGDCLGLNVEDTLELLCSTIVALEPFESLIEQTEGLIQILMGGRLLNDRNRKRFRYDCELFGKALMKILVEKRPGKMAWELSTVFVREIRKMSDFSPPGISKPKPGELPVDH